MNHIPQEIERKILNYDDNYEHMFICKSWFNVIKKKYNIKKDLATTLWKELNDFKKNLKNDHDTIEMRNAFFNKYMTIEKYTHVTINYLLNKIVYKKPIHIYFYRIVGGESIEQLDYNDYLQFKILKKNINKILNKVFKYKVRLHSKKINQINEFSRISCFELIMW